MNLLSLNILTFGRAALLQYGQTCRVPAVAVRPSARELGITDNGFTGRLVAAKAEGGQVCWPAGMCRSARRRTTPRVAPIVGADFLGRDRVLRATVCRALTVLLSWSRCGEASASMYLRLT